MSTMNREQLVGLIEQAFKNVTLLEGIGVLEADAIDNHAPNNVRKNERDKDIRDDWKSLSDDMIDEFNSALSFMDEDGLKFAIPAYARFAIKYFDRWPSASIESIIRRYPGGLADTFPKKNKGKSRNPLKLLKKKKIHLCV